jgi:hypothetical protein
MPTRKPDSGADGDRPGRSDQAPIEAPQPVSCAQCKQNVPADEAIQPEGIEYALYFCSPACFGAWRRERADELERRHRERSGTDQGH